MRDTVGAWCYGLAAGHGLPLPVLAPDRVPQLGCDECQLVTLAGHPMQMKCMHHA